MKTTGAEWNAYLASWPDGQWFDDSDETFDGKEPTTSDAPPNAVVEFTNGLVLNEKSEEVGDLVRHFRKWQKAQTVSYVLCEVPKDRLEELTALVAGIGGKVQK